MTKFVLLGLDGATFEMLDPMLDTGRLPVLSHLLRSGAHGVLESTIPPITFPAWPTMYTGRNPGAHGVPSFRILDSATLNGRMPTLRDVACPKLWTVLNQQGIRTGIFNVPATYPAEPVEGFMVSGFVTPLRAPGAVEPPAVRAGFTSTFPDYDCNGPFAGAATADKAANRRKMIEDLESTLAMRLEAIEYLLKREPVDFLWVVFEAIDRVSHSAYAYLSPESPMYDTAEGVYLRKRVLELLQVQDRAIGRILEQMGPDPSVMVVSDHGFAWTPRQFDLRGWLIDEGLMVPAPGKDGWARFKGAVRGLAYTIGGRGLWKLMGGLKNRVRGEAGPQMLKGKLGLGHRVAWDWEQSKTWLGFQFERGVRVNTCSRQGGPVVPPEHYDDVVQAIVDGLRNIRDSETGEPLLVRVDRRDHLYSGPYVERSPDVLFLMQRNVKHENSLLGKRSRSAGYVMPVEGIYKQNSHDINGVFAAVGGPFSAGEVSGASILDVMPTVLHGLGLGVSADLEGRVIEEAFTEDYRSSHPVQRVAALEMADVKAESVVYSAKDEEAISKRLEDLGYL